MSVQFGQVYRHLADAFKSHIDSLRSHLLECVLRLSEIHREYDEILQPGSNKPLTDEDIVRLDELIDKRNPFLKKQRELEDVIRSMEQQRVIFDNLATQFGS